MLLSASVKITGSSYLVFERTWPAIHRTSILPGCVLAMSHISTDRSPSFPYNIGTCRFAHGNAIFYFRLSTEMKDKPLELGMLAQMKTH